MALTPKEHRFVVEYLIDLNATQTAIRAGYSRYTARQIGSENLSKPAIREAIKIAMAERSERTAIDAAWVLTRLAAEVEADMADLYDDQGRLLPVGDWPLIWRTGLIVGVESDELEVGGVRMGSVRKVKQSDRIKRLELIGRHVGVQAFNDSVDVNLSDGLADRVARAKARCWTAAAVQPKRNA